MHMTSQQRRKSRQMSALMGFSGRLVSVMVIVEGSVLVACSCKEDSSFGMTGSRLGENDGHRAG